MGLGTAQHNISAALVVGVQNFTDPNVITTLLVGAILLLLLLLPTARQLGSRAQAPPQPLSQPQVHNGLLGPLKQITTLSSHIKKRTYGQPASSTSRLLHC